MGEVNFLFMKNHVNYKIITIDADTRDDKIVKNMATCVFVGRCNLSMSDIINFFVALGTIGLAVAAYISIEKIKNQLERHKDQQQQLKFPLNE